MGILSGYETVKNRQTVSGSQNYAVDTYHILDIEIDQGIETCSAGLCDTLATDIPLFKYHEVPDYMQGNPFVVHGYRVSLPFSLCVKSLFVWTNETINIWTHFGGFFIFLLLTLYDNLIVIPSYNGSFTDHAIITLGLFCFQFCMLCSTGFHIFCCHSERASRRWLAVDLTGISVGIIGCYLPAVHYAFYCLSIWRDIYLISICLLTAATIFVQLHPRFFSRSWFYLRLLIYIALVAYGIIPTIHWIILNGWSSRIVQVFVPKVTIMYFLGLIAFIFYTSKFPERIFPGMFDYLGSSHQWWHVIAVFSFVWWHKAGEEILLYRIEHGCHA